MSPDSDPETIVCERPAQGHWRHKRREAPSGINPLNSAKAWCTRPASPLPDIADGSVNQGDWLRSLFSARRRSAFRMIPF